MELFEEYRKYIKKRVYNLYIFFFDDIIMCELNIYIIHAKWLENRIQNIQNFKDKILKYNFKNVTVKNINIIDQYDPQELMQLNMNDYVSYEKTNSDYDKFMKNLHLFQVSNSLKHYHAFKLISLSNDNSCNIIVEDDILYEEKMCLLLDRFIDEKNKPEIVFFGLPNNIDKKYENVKKIFGLLPLNDSYYISKEFATKLFNSYLPIKFINNIQLDYICTIKLKNELFFSIPHIFIDGSKYGSHLSVLNPNNGLFFNEEYKKYATNQVQMCEKSPLDFHPDFMFLRAKYLTNVYKFEEALELYEKMFEIYRKNNCIINNESEFLREYMRLYSFINI